MLDVAPKQTEEEKEREWEIGRVEEEKEGKEEEEEKRKSRKRRKKRRIGGGGGRDYYIEWENIFKHHISKDIKMYKEFTKHQVYLKKKKENS